MKTSFIYLIFFIILVSDLKAQNKILSVPFISQRTDSWCWAACMESILNYHNVNNVSQCNLAKNCLQILRFNGKISLKQFNDGIKCCDKNCDEEEKCTSFSNKCDSCNMDLPSSKATISKPNPIKFFERIFELQAFLANERADTMSWDDVKNQINLNKPFIINVAMQDREAFGVHNLHALVAKGYLENANKFIICSNPWKYIIKLNGKDTCLTYRQTCSLNYKVFRTDTGVYKKVNTYVINISKSQIVTPRMAFFSKSNNKKIEFQEDNRGVTNDLTDIELEKLLTVKNFLKLKVNYLVTDNFNSNITGIDKLIAKKDIIDIIDFNTKPAIITSMQKIGDKWIPIEIYEDDIENSLIVNVNSEKIKLNNNESVNSNTVYEVVKIYPYPYEFYKFNLNKTTYLTPRYTYTDLKLQSGKQVCRNEAYREFRIVNTLKNIESKNYNIENINDSKNLNYKKNKN
jgi:Papain-like cysteine protease AvrRpt2